MHPDVVYDVFLSHDHHDAKIVEQLAEKLEDDAKLKVWFDKWVLVPGRGWQQPMARGIKEAKAVAVCIGTDTPDGWFRREMERALNRQTQEADFGVIPVVLPNGDRSLVDDFLELNTWVRFGASLDDAAAFQRLVAGIRGDAPGRTGSNGAVS